jgi:nitrite reductase/ring-hydroxylating ferredoxin subunit
VQLGLAGYGAMLLSAYLGGQMVYDHKVGVKREAQAEPPEKFTRVMAVKDLPEDTPTRADADGLPILLVRRGDQVYALAETCTHLGGPLSEGTLEGDSVICPWHGSRFRLSDGQPLDGPSPFSQTCFEARIRSGGIEVRQAFSAAPPPAQIKPAAARKSTRKTAQKTAA